MPAEQTPAAIPPDPRKIQEIYAATSIDRQITDAPFGSPKLLRLTVRRQFQSYYWLHPPRWKVALRYLRPGRMMPSFFSLGAARSGTTLLADYIMQHPCVVLPLAKEFAAAAYPNLRYLQAQFPSLREKREVEERYGMAITGICSPAVPNLMFPYMLAGAVGDLDLKFILMLRNPVDRTFSHWKWEKHVSRRGDSDPLTRRAPDFGELTRLEVDAAQSYATSGATFYSGAHTGGFIQNSIYLPFVKTMLKFWDRSRILVINSDDFFADPGAIAKQAYAFLELPAYEPVPLPVRNAGPPGTMDPEARKMLAEFFSPLNTELYEFLGQDFGWS